MNKYLNYFGPLIIVLFFIVYFSPYLINGEDSFIRIHDNLDQSNLVGIYEMVISKEVFSKKENLIDFSFSTLDQQFKLSIISFDKILFYLFGYFLGFIVNEFIIRVTGFLGMILLIETFQNQKNFRTFSKFSWQYLFVHYLFIPKVIYQLVVYHFYWPVL